ncbi:MAG TPA: FGLLP motif-containing membrane protein, partial [Candidatus Limnocylindrales bacterium]
TPNPGPVATGPAPTESTTGTGGGTGGATPSFPTFDQSVLGITDVNMEVPAVGGSLLLALLLLLIIAFAGELFNNTVENNYSIIAAWFKKGPFGWLRRMGGKLGGEARVGLLIFLALTALISSFVDPHFGFDLRSLAEFLGFLFGLIVVLASFKLPMMLAHKRKTGELGKLRPLPWALIIAALFVLISRIGNLQPGYLYGIVLGAIFVKDVEDKEEGRETFYGSFWTLVAAVVSWVGLNWVRGLGFAEDGFGVTVLSTAFAVTLVAGLEAAAFGLMPMRFMPGHMVYKWNRLGWALLFGLSVFAFVHLLIGPTSGYVSELAPEAFLAALGVFAAFGALSIVTWLYFRFRGESHRRMESAGPG